METNTSASMRGTALVAGIGYLIIIACGIFAEFFIRGSLIETGNAAETARNIRESETFFRFGIAGDVIMILADVIVGFALYRLFRPVSGSLALVAAWFRLAQAAVLAAMLVMLFLTLQLVTDSQYANVFGSDQLDALVLLFAEAHSYGYILALFFFGAHLAVLGFLVLRSTSAPNFLGVLFMFAAAGYLLDSFANVLLSNYSDYETLFAIAVFAPAFVGELAMGIWLIARAGRGSQAPRLRSAGRAAVRA